ncbi:MAG: glycosyltransferase [Planctomycetota bacterium]
MRVLLIHEHGGRIGSGAVVAMWRLHKGLQAKGVESTIACRKKLIDDDSIVLLPDPTRLEGMLGRITWRLGLNDVHCLSSYQIPSMPAFRNADIVNIHGWHTNFLSYRALPRLSREKPIVGTMHDMWCLTGHCAMSLGCDRWRTGCGQCPQLDIFPPVARDATAWTWKMKKAAFERSENLTMVSPSRWLADLTGQSMLGHLPLHQIDNCVDTEIYHPIDKATARRELGLPVDGPVLMFCSVDLKSTLKGGDLLIESLKRLPESLRNELTLLLVGHRGHHIADATQIPTVELGFVNEDERKALAYSAADVLLMPSRYETQGLVVIEAMSCGTPAVAFDTGGLPEVIRQGPAGFIAPYEDVDAMAEYTAQLFDDTTLRAELGANGRRAVLERYAVDMHVDKHIRLFENILAGTPDASIELPQPASSTSVST